VSHISSTLPVLADLSPVIRFPENASNQRLAARLACLNGEQAEAAAVDHGQLLVLSPAGTGKTEQMTVRIARLICEGLALPDEILALTFTNKAAREMRARIGAMLGQASQPHYVGTFHRIGLDMLRAAPHLAGLKTDFDIASESQMLDIVKAAMKKAGHGTRKKNRFAADPAKLVAEKFARLKDDGYRPSEADRWLTAFLDNEDPDAANESNARIAASIAVSVQASLRRRNLADFSDMVLWPTLALEEDADYRQAWAGRFRYVVIDEYQDVNNIQYRFGKISASIHRNIAVVGDDDQNLYAFRGSSPEFIRRFTRDWPQAKIVTLRMNYRSVQPILDAASLLIAHNSNRYDKPMIAAGAAVATGKPPVTAIECRNDAHEAETVVRAIMTRAPNIELDDCAVLYRSAYQGRAIEDALHKQGLGFGVIGGVSFYRRKEILDALALLTLVEAPDTAIADEAFIRVATAMIPGVGPAAMGKLQAIAKQNGISLLSAAGQRLAGSLPATASQNIDAFLDALAATNFIDDGLGAVLRDLLESTGYNLLIANQKDAQEKRENLIELCNLADRFADGFSFLDHCTAAGQEAETAGQFGRVQLSTIHGAKGLEYGMVCLVGCAEGHFPSTRSLGEGRLDEERRLAYVGITRAKHVCLMTWPRFGANRSKPSQPSRFIAEAGIEATLLEEDCTPAKKMSRRRRRSASKKFGPARKPWEPKDRYWLK